jgi:electron transfer flavoprotein beta subunit
MGVELDEANKKVKVTREMEAGMNEISNLDLPAVLEIQAGLNKPRYASLRGIMQAKKKEISEPGPGDLVLAPESLGETGAKIEVLSVAFPEAGKGAQIIEGDAETAARTLVEKLQKEARIL